ncbi:MAG: sigma-54 dependent transcriptional regulator [Thermodesulfobacteriota bacterium]|nr:sigma-54 dependent transcriptional regulator [Thermodesulfobacteriota bacterium]
MGKTLFAWVGSTDLRAAQGEEKSGLGPIAHVAVTYNYTRIILLDNYGGKEDVVAYIDWLKKKCSTEIIRRKVKLASPIDFAAIYLIAESEVRKELSSCVQQSIPVFHLSPGTPAMASVWVLLGKARFQNAELVRSSVEVGVETVHIPFEISAEFSPAIAKAADEHLAKLTKGLPPEAPEFEHIVHKCAEMKKLVAQARIVALRDVPVLIEGETGTGKELFARAIHEASPRKENKFISVNCGAIPKELFEAEFFGHKKGAFTGADKDRSGYFESADGGTLFLDELSELPLDAQVKILRVLNDGKVVRVGGSEERSADVRIIAATNRNLLSEVSAGRFRSDLFYRLAVAMLKLPPLHERTGDLGIMIESILKQVNAELSTGTSYKNKNFSTKAKNLMLQHPWPGNARELFNTIMRICVWCPEKTIQEDDVRQALLPSPHKQNDDILRKPLGNGFQLQEILDVISTQYISKALKESAGNKSKAANLLGMKNYQTLSNWMEKLDICD